MRPDRTAHGYRRFRCRACGRRFKERTGTTLNRLQRPTDVVFLEALRKRRKGRIGWSWPVDETGLKGGGRWQSLSRAIDSGGPLVDVEPSETRDHAAAETFFRSAVAVTGIIPETIATDEHAGYPPALDEVFRDDVEHRTSKCENNHLEQDRRGIEGRTRPMRGSKSSTSASRLLLRFSSGRRARDDGTQ